MSCRVRPAIRSDAPELARLTLELGYTHSLPEIESRLHALLQRPDHFIAVAVGDTPPLLGWVAAERLLILESGDIVEIVGLVIDATRQRAGTGRALVAVTEQWAASQGVSTLFTKPWAMSASKHNMRMPRRWDPPSVSNPSCFVTCFPFWLDYTPHSHSGHL